jgi:hypothetical protein
MNVHEGSPKVNEGPQRFPEEEHLETYDNAEKSGVMKERY